MPRPTATKLPAEAIHENPGSRGEGDFVFTRNPSRPSEKRKRRKSAFTGISPAAAPRCFTTSTPEEKARRLAALRAVLADSAPEFQARIDAGERGKQKP